MKALLLLFSIISASAQLTTVPFTRTFLLKTNAATALAYLGGTSSSNVTLSSMVVSGSLQFLTNRYDVNGILTNAVVMWPDSTLGTFNATVVNTNWFTIDAYTVTYSSQTVTQPTVSRDTNGSVTNKPPLVITP
jgi:hypothetical protein